MVAAFGLVGVAPASAHNGDWGGRRHGNDHDNDGGHDRRHHHRGNGALFVSPQANPSDAGRSCDSATYNTIGAAVAAAPAGGTVIVCWGTYAEDVLVNKPLNLLSWGATIDATGLENGIQVVASDVRVDGFTLENANGEGILVGVDTLADASLLPSSGPVLSDVRIDNNRTVDNDKGFNFTESGNCKYPGDCGGGIHLNVTTNSEADGNTVTGNADGILLTDDYGPASHNRIDHNVVNDNVHECGIVLASHSTTAVTFDATTYAVTNVNPTEGGIYDTLVRDNVADDNGTDKAPPQFGGGGSGSGVGLFASGPGSAVYDNVVVGNEASGNGLAGIAMHAHLPGGESIDGNVFLHNDLGMNNVGGDGFDGPPGPTDFQTTGLAIYSAVPAHMVIRDNCVHDNAIGLWLSTTITAHHLEDNSFHNVTTPVVTG